jgi:CubicO group peptidase (beta-lactamase class C family)
VADRSRTTYAAAFGKRDSASRTALTTSAIFRIASMTKAITTTAALQLVEQGKLELDGAAAAHLPDLEHLQILEGFDSGGEPRLRPTDTPVTLRRLLTHTAGFAYETWNAELLRYRRRNPKAPAPLMTEPGTRWEYSTGLDWTGRLVEAVSEQKLEAYFQKHILQPLGMTDTSFILPAAKFSRLVSSCQRQPDGTMLESPRKQPTSPKSFNGGGGLYSTAADYVRFMQMILRRGAGPDNRRILAPETVAMMTTNQIGDLSAGKLKTAQPDRSSDVDFHPGTTDGFTFGFLINHAGYRGGRSAGSLAWAGMENTFFWIDPHRELCAVLMMQFLPFCDAGAMEVLRAFENAVYA